MHSLIKTALIAAVGAAVVAGPALAQKRSDRALIYGGVYGGAYGLVPPHAVPVPPPPFVGDPGAQQIVNEYLKDAPIHSGTAY